VFVDFHDEITTDAGEKLVLRDLMQMRDDSAKREPPSLAAKFWPEYQGKQMLVSSFFTKRGVETKALATTAPAIAKSALTTPFDALDAPDSQPPPPSSAAEPPQVPRASSSSSQPATSDPSPPPPSSSQASNKPPPPPRTRLRDSTSVETSKLKKHKSGQSKLSSFFSQPSTSATAPKPHRTTSPPEIINLCEDSEEVPPEAPLPTITSELRPPSDTPPSTSQGEENAAKSAASWSALFAPVPPPRCTVHDEPAKQFRVKKPGPNKGRTFYLCARPVGPGYDKGRSERLREEVNYEYKCDFFKWTSDVKREAMRLSAGGGAVGGRKTRLGDA